MGDTVEKTLYKAYQTKPEYLCSIHTGIPLASLHQNSEERVTVDKKVVASCLDRIKSIVAKL